jgi:hypothetical protein
MDLFFKGAGEMYTHSESGVFVSGDKAMFFITIFDGGL